MSDVILSPNMNLPVPVVGEEPGPDWANNINACLGILDQHSHVSGQGVPITPAALNINSDLTFQGNNITNLKALIFASQVSPIIAIAPYLGAVYVAGNELYYNDEAGNQVQITLNGSVNSGAGSISGLPSGTASASYSAGSQTFVWQSATNTPANMDFASAIFRNLVANSFGLTLNPPNAMGADYDVTLPPPNSSGSMAFLTYDTSNNVSVGPSIVNGITFSMLSTMIQSMLNSASPTGIFVPFGGTVAPTGWLICDGTAISRTTFSDLFAVIGTAYGNGDGTTTFNLPPPGVFFRNTDPTGVNDPDFSARTSYAGGNSGGNVGSFQQYQLQSHTHNMLWDTTQNGVSPFYASLSGNGIGNGATNDVFPGPINTGGNQTNPVNMNATYIIKT